MSDWAGACIIDGFPKENMTYYIQFINEPKIIPKKSQYGKDYKMAQIALQFFAIDEFGEFHYMDWDNLEVKPCVLEDLTCLGPEILCRLIKTKGIVHKKHVDLELLDSYNYIDPRTLQPEPEPGPPKHPTLETSTVPPVTSEVKPLPEWGQPGAEGEQQSQVAPVPPHSPSANSGCDYKSDEPPTCPRCQKPATTFKGEWVHCGERVG